MMNCCQLTFAATEDMPVRVVYSGAYSSERAASWLADEASARVKSILLITTERDVDKILEPSFRNCTHETFQLKEQRDLLEHANIQVYVPTNASTAYGMR